MVTTVGSVDVPDTGCIADAGPNGGDAGRLEPVDTNPGGACVDLVWIPGGALGVVFEVTLSDFADINAGGPFVDLV